MVSRKTVQRIQEWVKGGKLPEPFSAGMLKALGIGYASTFLPKHRVGNPGGNTEHFFQVSHYPALYRLR